MIKLTSDWGYNLTTPSNENKGKVKWEKSKRCEKACQKKIIIKNENVEVISMKSMLWSIQPHEFFCHAKIKPKNVYCDISIYSIMFETKA
ncbi:hypothetical protein H5410_000777 [Solanum commersonii]|uniref:Uncharacterized protein n=1 Tax=Solanum commersonii TaxID=4109 RepID=A0A9J6AX69_SOLCO|nr:hypothetical protein H5410_000777 [Solanum commersonii]